MLFVLPQGLTSNYLENLVRWAAAPLYQRCFTKTAYYTHLPEMAQFYRIISRCNSKRLTILNTLLTDA